MCEIALAISVAVTFASPGEGQSLARRGVMEIFEATLGWALSPMMLR
jgi:hypothetical protein